MAVVTVRIPDEKKEQAMKIVQEMWISLSSAVNIFINNLVRTRKIVSDLNDTIDDTHMEWYTDKNSFEIDVTTQEFLTYAKSLQDKEVHG